MKRTVYLDNAATTKPDPRVIEAMLPYLINEYGNPSAAYEFGYAAKAEIDDARRKIGKVIGAKYDEILITSGATESINMILRGVPKPGDHVITSVVEHHALLNVCHYLESIGVDVTYIGVDKNCRVDPADIERSIRPNTVLLAVMSANNETGVVQDIRRIGEIAHSHGIPFFTDATQAFGKEDINVSFDNIDFLCASAHKIYGPKGVGMLYIRHGLEVPPLIFGGGQQNGLRGGTENVPGVVAFGKAAELAYGDEFVINSALRKYFIHEVKENVSDVIINGNEFSMNNIVSISFDGIRGEALLRILEMYGVLVSTGSACNSSSGEASHVLTAMGLSEDEANSTIRFSFSHETTKEDLDYTVNALKIVVPQLRAVRQ